MPSASRLAVAITALLTAPQVLATHFRYGVITWEHVSGGSYGQLFDFTIQVAFRDTYFSPSPSLTRTVDTGTAFVPDMNYLSKGNTEMVVTPNVINTNQDWFIGTQTFAYEYPSGHTGAIVGFFINCCRISTLINNHDMNWQITVTVPVVAGQVRSSLKTTQVPITSLVVNTVNTFQLGVLNYSGPVTYRLATSTEASGSNSVSNYFDVSGTNSWSAPSNFAIDSVTGVMTFNTNSPITTGLYTTQVIVTETTSSDYSTMAVDWILQVVSSGALQCKRFCYNQFQYCGANTDCTNCNGVGYPLSNSVAGYPYCDTNTAPYFYKVVFGAQSAITLTAGTSYSGTYSVQYGSTAVITIYAIDADIEDYVTLGTGVLPSGATFTYGDTAGDTYLHNPVTGVFTWNMGTSTGGIVCFTASDGFHTNIGTTCVTLTIGAGTLTCSGDGMLHAIAGNPTTFTCAEASGRTLVLALTSFTSGSVSSTSGHFSVSSTTSTTGATYSVGYNVTGAGIYSLEVSDTTSGITQLPQPVFSTLTVYPNVTYPSSTNIFDQGSTGWTGGQAGAAVSFYLNAYDYFGNLQSLQRTDQFTFKLNYTSAGKTITSASTSMFWQNGTDSAGNQLYRYGGNYTVPNPDNGYSVCVYYATSATATPVLVKCKTMTVVTTAFILVSTSSTTFTAGDIYTGTFTSVLASDGTTPYTTQATSMQVTVNGVSSTLSYSSGVYTVTGPNITVAQSYTNGIVFTAPGLEGTAGIQQFSFTYYPGIPSYRSTVAPLSVFVEFNSLTAGESFVAAVTLKDAFGNLCNHVHYPVTATLTDSKGAQTSYTASVGSQTGVYNLPLSVTVIGTSSLSVVASISGAFATTSSVTLPYVSLIVGPGLLSTVYSGLTSTSTLVAGYQSTLTLTAADGYDNPRNILNGDSFEVTFVRDYDGSAQTAFYVQDPTTFAYVFFLQTQYNGPHTLKILYSIPNSGFGQFTQQDVTVHAGVLVNTTVTGKGSKGGYEQTTAEVIVQAADKLSNVIENTGFGYAVDSTTGLASAVSGTQAYIARVQSVNGQMVTCSQSAYCTPGSTTCTYPSTSSNFTASNLTSAVNDQELAFYSAGFFRVYYTVPHVHDVPGFSKLFNATFNLSIWRFDPTTVSHGRSLCAIIDAGNATLIANLNAIATAVPSGDNAAQQTVNSVVFGTLAGCMFVSAVGYGAWRLARYRPKYLQERERANEAEGMVKDIKEEALIPGVRDYAAVGGGLVTQNPLHEANKSSHTALKADYAREVNPAYTGGKMTEMTATSSTIKGASRGASLKKF